MQALSTRIDDDSCFFIQWIKRTAIDIILAQNFQSQYLLH